MRNPLNPAHADELAITHLDQQANGLTLRCRTIVRPLTRWSSEIIAYTLPLI
jgi:hypothetical protein